MQVKKSKGPDEIADFEMFMERRLIAAKAYVTGNPDPLSAIAARDSNATFFGPGGGYEEGAEHVENVYRRDAKAFGEEGDTDFEILQSNASADIGYWIGFQTADVTLGGKQAKMKLRITEIFRRENDEWKLVHRHADPLTEKKEK